MTFQLCPIAEVAENSSDSILDYTYISEENFLLVISLTSEANLLIYYKTSSSPKIISVSIHDIYEECGDPQRITITPDAAVVVLILSDGDILMIPIKVLMDVNWGENNSICSEPIRFSINVSIEEKSFRSPTSTLSFNSLTTNRSYVVYSNKAGHINFIDLALQRLIANFSSTDSILSIELHRSSEQTSLLVTNSTGSQFLLPLENEDFSLRETLAHIIPNELSMLDQNYKYSCNNANGYVTALHSASSTVNVYQGINHSNGQNLPIHILKAPENTCLVHFSNQLLITVSNVSSVHLNLHFLDVDRDNPQYINIENKHKVLGFISVINAQNKLDECLLVTEKAIGWIRTTKSVNELALNLLIQSYFASEVLVKIAYNLNSQPKQLCLTMLRDVLKDEKRSEYNLNGVVSLAFEINISIEEIMGTLEEFNESDAVLPLLSAKLEKDPTNQDCRRYFFNGWMAKLLKLNNKETENEMQKDNLEEELKVHLIKFEATKEMMSVLLKQSLWSCVAVVLSRDAPAHSPIVARFLLELQSWRLVKTAQLIKCLSFLHWPSIESFTPTLITKMLAFLPNIQSNSQLALIVSIAQSLSHKFENALTLYVIALIRLLNITSELNVMFLKREIDKPHGPQITPTVLSCGSNCTLSITVDETLVFWGEFTAGNLKMRNEEPPKTPKKIEKGKTTTGVLSTKRQTLKRKYSSITTLLPKTIPLPYCHDHDILEYKPQAVACGTEHLLVLTTDGSVFSWGTNRYGQCGVGHNDRVKTPIKLNSPFGRVKSVYAGHYHSGLIDENDEIWMWGWGLYGQLAMDCTGDYFLPKRVESLSGQKITSMTLGYAHSLFLSSDGAVYGCGSTVYGQLGIDPLEDGVKQMNKCKIPVRIPIPEPVRLLSSDYFQGVAIGSESNMIYQWGACPQTLKMRMFLIKRLRNSAKKAGKDSPTVAPDEQKELEETPSKNGSENAGPAPSPRLPMELSREYMRVSPFYHWQHESSISQISAGFNHSALVTANGELFTWGKSLDMQLGHGNKKEKDEPCQLIEPRDVQWTQVVAGRSSTTAVTSTGSVYVWGRNDKSQLGLGQAKKVAARKIVLKATRGQKIVELPDDSCIGQPAQIPGLKLAALQVLSAEEQERNLIAMLSTADQHTLNTISRYLVKHPINMFIVVHVHLLAGDILSAIDALCLICEKTSLLKKSSRVEANSSRGSPASTSLSNSRHSTSSPARTPERSLCPHTSPKRSVAYGSNISSPRSTAEPNRNTLQHLPTASRSPMDDHENGNDMSAPSSPIVPQKSMIETFDDLLDRAWNLVRIHPFREVQTIVLIRMLCSHFPIYHRLAADPRLCRLVDPHIELVSSSIHSSDSLSSRRLMDLTVRERHAALKTARLPSEARVKAIRQKSDQCAAIDRLRFYNECGHYEKCVVETGPGKLEFAALRNKLRKCTKCVTRNKVA